MNNTNPLGRKAILASLSIGMPRTSIEDKRLTEESRKLHGTRQVKQIKQLYPPNRIDPIIKIRSRARDHVYYRYTIAWPDNGWQLLPAMLYDKYVAEMRDLKSQWTMLTAQFVAEWDDIIAESRRLLNGTFNYGDYESVHSIAEKFYFSYEKFRPVPDSGSYYVDIGTQAMDELKQAADEEASEYAKHAKKELVLRISAPLSNLIERITADKRAISPDAIANINEIIELADSFNFDGDPTIKSVVDEIRTNLQLDNLTAEQISEQVNEDKQAKAQVLAKAEAIAKRMRQIVI